MTNFVKRVREEFINPINPNLYLSAALMPPCEDTVKWYGPDYGQMAQYLDFLVPMIYRYSFNGDSNWIAKVTSIAVSKANGAPVLWEYRTTIQIWTISLSPLPNWKMILNQPFPTGPQVMLSLGMVQESM